MGWTEYTNGRPRPGAEERAEMARLLTWETDISTAAPVRLCKCGSVWYGAVRVVPKDGLCLLDRTYHMAPDGSFTFAVVFLTARSNGNWRYKDMSEDMGPVESRAPRAILDLLSPIKDPDSYAAAWRARCAAWLNRPSFKTGDRVRLKQPITLQSGTVVSTCTITNYRRGTRNMRCYRDCETGALFRMREDTLLGAELITPAQAADSDILAEFHARKAQS